MKRVRLERKTPLTAGASLLRRTRLNPASARKAADVGAGIRPKAKRPAPAVPADVRHALTVRSGRLCEMRLHGCTSVATDPAHRIARGMGGRHGAAKTLNDRLSSVLHACRTCHQWSEASPRESYELGLMLRNGQDPTVEPVVYRGRLSLLTDDGRVLPFPTAVAA